MALDEGPPSSLVSTFATIGSRPRIAAVDVRQPIAATIDEFEAAAIRAGILTDEDVSTLQANGCSVKVVASPRNQLRLPKAAPNRAAFFCRTPLPGRPGRAWDRAMAAFAWRKLTSVATT